MLIRGCIAFVIDPSVDRYEWLDDSTVRIHPDALAEMLEFQAA